MAVDEQSQAPLRYMTVPEKIELGGGVGGGAEIPREPSGGGGRYRPMKVPDMITLEPTRGPPPVATGLSSGEGGERDGTGVGRGMAQRGGFHGGAVQSGFQPSEPTSNLQGAPPMHDMMSEPDQSSPALVDLERRVRTLENQVQRLTNTIVNNRPPTATPGSNQGNGFWYVLTFTGWMMVPLVVVFMYHFKKNLS